MYIIIYFYVFLYLFGFFTLFWVWLSFISIVFSVLSFFHFYFAAKILLCIYPNYSETYIISHDTKIGLKMYGYTVICFSIIFYKGKQLPWSHVCISGRQSLAKCGSTLKGKNLLLWEQILSYKSWSIHKREANMKIVELLPLKVYSLILIIVWSTLDISKLKFISNYWYCKVNFMVPENFL